MTRSVGTIVKFAIFGVVMTVLTAFLFVVFGESRSGATEEYSAVFTDASRLEAGDSVRIAGIRVGTVKKVSLQADRKVLVEFDADRSTKLTDGTKAAIRYLNLVGIGIWSSSTPRVGQDPAGRRADPRRSHGTRTGPRSVAGWAETRYPGPESAGCQCPHDVAGPDPARAGRHDRIAVLQDVVVLELARRQQSGDRAVDRRAADGAGHPVQGRRRVLRSHRPARAADQGPVLGP